MSSSVTGCGYNLGILRPDHELPLCAHANLDKHACEHLPLRPIRKDGSQRDDVTAIRVDEAGLSGCFLAVLQRVARISSTANPRIAPDPSAWASVLRDQPLNFHW